MNLRKNMVMSDVDGTIVRGSLVNNHAVFLHENGVIDLGLLPDMWMNNQKDENLIMLLAESYRANIVGMTEQELLTDEFIDEFLSNPDNFYTTLNRLIEFRNNGTPVVLISGSPQFLVERFAMRFGFTAHASDYKKDSRGRFTGECVGMFSGDAKRECISALNLSSYHRVYAFGDTCSDEPLFDNAHHSYLVDPNESTRNRLEHKVQRVIRR